MITMAKIVEITWIDITSCDSINHEFTDYENLLAECKNIGYLIYQDKKILVLAHHETVIPDGQGEVHRQEHDIFVLPRSVVKKIRVLK